MLFKMHMTLPPDVLAGHRERFTKQFRALRKFYESTSNLQYFKDLIAIPPLPEVSAFAPMRAPDQKWETAPDSSLDRVFSVFLAKIRALVSSRSRQRHFWKTILKFPETVGQPTLSNASCCFRCTHCKSCTGFILIIFCSSGAPSGAGFANS